MRFENREDFRPEGQKPSSGGLHEISATMIGMTGSRHVGSKRRGSSPCVNPIGGAGSAAAAAAARRLSTQLEEDESDIDSDERRRRRQSDASSRRESRVSHSMRWISAAIAPQFAIK